VKRGFRVSTTHRFAKSGKHNVEPDHPDGRLILSANGPYVSLGLFVRLYDSLMKRKKAARFLRRLLQTAVI